MAIINGTSGDDTLNGSDLSDTLNGGAGNDVLDGNGGNDTYLFGVGDGQDVIASDYSSSTTRLETLEFKAGVTAGQVTATRTGGGNDLTLSITGTTDKITITNFFGYGSDGSFQSGGSPLPTDNSYNSVQQVKFADGTIWDTARIMAQAMIGSSGADTIYGSNFSDTIVGGAGNDVLDGNGGNDTYFFGIGDGQDVIASDYSSSTIRLETLGFKAGVTAGQITAIRSGNGNDLTLSITGTTDKITITNFFGYGSDGTFQNGGNPLPTDNSYNSVQQVKFADGTIWDTARIMAQAMIGSSGADTIYGSNFSDTIVGGAGNDVLDGNGGNDTYFFGIGDGQDVIASDYSSSTTRLETLEFKAGVSAGQVTATRTGGGNDLTLSITGTTDKITITNFFGYGSDGTFQNGGNPLPTDNSYNSVQQVKFADGTIWDTARIMAQAMIGSSGADTIYGSNFSDTIVGGAGNDVLDGNGGNDTYFFGIGDGQDVIASDYSSSTTRLETLEFKAGVSAGQVTATRTGGGNDLTLSITGTTDKITITNFFGYGSDGTFQNGGNPLPTDNSYNSVQQVKFADGTIWDTARIMAQAMIGSSGADTIYGSNFSDTIVGGAGNDVLDGNGGNDTYFFGIGDGQDVIASDYSSSTTRLETLEFKAGVSAGQVTATRTGGGNDLTLSITGTTDKITITNFFGYGSDGTFQNGGNPLPTDNSYNSVQQVKFADGTIWDTARIMAQAMIGSSSADTIYGSSFADTINGGAGNDVLDGNGGNDTYLFGVGSGQDVISSDYSSATNRLDTLEFAAGVQVGQIVATRTGTNDLTLAIIGTKDQVTISGFYGSATSNPIQQVKFSDGTIWDLAYMSKPSFTGTSAADNYTGTSSNDFISGGQGNDVLNGASGNDVLNGGKGNNELYGGAGDDSYIVGNSLATEFQISRWETKAGGFWDAQKWLHGDFNGDGKADLVNVFNDNGLMSGDVHASTGNGFQISRWETAAGGFWDAQKWLSGDFNGDGKADLVNVFNDNGLMSGDVHVSTGSGFQISRWETKAGGFWDSQKWLSGDFNGDGKADLVNVFNDNGLMSADVHVSTGSGFQISRWETKAGGIWDAQKWLAADVNGDGKTDLINIFSDGGLTSVDVHVSTGSGFVIERWETKAGGFWDAQKWSVADVNGDGKADLINVFNDKGLASVDVHVSEGAGFVIQRWETRSGGFWDGQKWAAADFNGDGKADLVNIFSDNGLASVDVHQAVSDQSDKVFEYTGQGNDTIRAFTDYTLPDNVESLILVGESAIKGIGNAMDNGVFGNDKNNFLNGASGNDILSGGLGNDTLTGGIGNDFFVFDTSLNSSSNIDVVTDFAVGVDKIRLDDSIFTSLTGLSSLSSGQFLAAAGATSGLDANDFVIYNKTDGKLYYDADGSGSQAAVAFTQIGVNLTLDYTHFQVI